jgi:hypothetical protein
MWHLSNMQTWASDTLMDTSTCLDSLGNGRDKQDTVRRVLAVALSTSNTLTLINKLDPVSCCLFL